MGSTFGMMGAVSCGTPPAAGGFGVLAGLSGILGVTMPKDKPAETLEGQDVRGSLSKMVDKAFDASIDHVNKVLKAIYTDGLQEDIPESLIKQSWSAEAVRALGDGQWIVDTPTFNLEALGNHLAHQMKQELAWQMLRLRTARPRHHQNQPKLKPVLCPQRRLERGQKRVLQPRPYHRSRRRRRRALEGRSRRVRRRN
ncbi:hypothetical protein K458DRAFT_431527 [Lentithecium fluviatile CBS 122367]|uniref:Uncharacterized protein n=1 Tax=Lentithecium fluviatile CBS 122367 TaxID=1168545 RepID=A0A6G1J318_9PLEO|nr:hypothetical protein K458DRAFT_431527 [Lentithecium fluviatile CBS 122367]